MLSSKLLDLIDHSAGQMSERWRDWIRNSHHMVTYQKLSDEVLVMRSKGVIINLGKWIDRGFTMEEVGRVYVEVGRERYREGFPLCEVGLALHYTKKVVWNHIMSEGLMTNAMEIYQATDLIVSIQHFFDIAAFYIIRGYQEEMYLRMNRDGGIPMDTLNRFFPPESFHLTYDSDLS